MLICVVFGLAVVYLLFKDSKKQRLAVSCNYTFGPKQGGTKAGGPRSKRVLISQGFDQNMCFSRSGDREHEHERAQAGLLRLGWLKIYQITLELIKLPLNSFKYIENYIA